MAADVGATRALLEALGRSWRSGMERAISEAVEVGVDAARDVVPVDTGRLRASIAGRAQGLAGAVEAAAPYAAYVELGTGGPRGSAAQPYMRPAFLRATDVLIRRAKEVIAWSHR